LQQYGHKTIKVCSLYVFSFPVPENPLVAPQGIKLAQRCEESTYIDYSTMNKIGHIKSCEIGFMQSCEFIVRLRQKIKRKND